MKKSRFKPIVFAVLLLSLWIGALGGQVASQAIIQRTLTILGTTDLHGNIWGFSYEDNKETTNNGMARIATYVQKVRAESPNVILIDNGDAIQGTILTDDIYNKRSGPHPLITAMNEMKYDSMTLGNHEFNFGIGLVERIQALAEFPVLAANMARKDGTMAALPYTIIERDGIKIGIIGLTNPNIPRWDSNKVDSLVFAPVAQACRKTIDVIKNKVDIIVVSAHVGLYPEYDEENGSDGAMKIFELCPEIDALLIGHTHTKLAQTIGTTVVGEARNSGRDVVRFDLGLDEKKKVISRSVEVVDMANYQPSDLIRKNSSIIEAHETTRNFITSDTSSGDKTFAGGVFGVAAANFQPKNEIRGIPEGKLRDTAVMDLINTVQLINSGADVSAAALFSDTSDIPEGNINYGTIFGIYKFDNTLYRVPITGAELKKYMEWSASCYNQWVPGDISISFDPEKPGYLYDMFAGVDYEIDLSKPAGQRIVNVMYKGAPLRDDEKLTLAVNNYRYSSALKAEKLVAGKPEWESPNSIRDMLVAYIKEKGTIYPSVDNNWKIVGVDLSSPYRQYVIDLVNEGKLDVPYNQSLNIDRLKEQGIIK